MIQFIAGCVVGAIVCFFMMGIAFVSEDEDDRADKCRGCPYEGYASGAKDCLKCHGAEDDR